MHKGRGKGTQVSRIERMGALITVIMMPDLKTSEREGFIYLGYLQGSPQWSGR